MSMDQRIAIILHGPPCTGKSTVSGEIFRRLPRGEARWINLDLGWGPEDANYRCGPYGYTDLYEATERVLLIELAHGEPADKTMAGAVRGAKTWVTLLRHRGRAVFPFRLWRTWPDAVRQLLLRWESGPFPGFIGQLNNYRLYTQGSPEVTFPPIDGFEERVIVTTGRTSIEAANEIMMLSGL